MDIHVKVASALHIVCGAFVLLILASVMIFMGGLAALANLDPHLMAIAATLGGVLFSAFGILGAAQIVAGILCFRGSKAARAVLVVFSAFSLVNFPIGSAIGGYSLWAFLRKDQDQADVADARNA
jgi:hypothetical protein